MTDGNCLSLTLHMRRASPLGLRIVCRCTRCIDGLCCTVLPMCSVLRDFFVFVFAHLEGRQKGGREGRVFTFGKLSQKANCCSVG